MTDEEEYFCHTHLRIKVDNGGCFQCYDEKRGAAKAQRRLEKNKAKQLSYTIPKVSEQQARLNREMAKTRKEIKAERGDACEGCGRREGGFIILEDSHVISRDQCRDYNRMDLYTAKRNRRRLCRSWMDHNGCHGKWESNSERHTLPFYKEDMQFIKQETPTLCAVMLMNEARAKQLKHAI